MAEKYKCRPVAQGFRQVEGIHYTKKYSPTPAAASIRILLATAAGKDGEMRHFDVDQAFLEANIDEEISKFRYREAVRALMWTATMIRPDIACAVRAMTRSCENPDWRIKKRC